MISFGFVCMCMCVCVCACACLCIWNRIAYIDQEDVTQKILLMLDLFRVHICCGSISLGTILVLVLVAGSSSQFGVFLEETWPRDALSAEVEGIRVDKRRSKATKQSNEASKATKQSNEASKVTKPTKPAKQRSKVTKPTKPAKQQSNGGDKRSPL